MKDTTPLVRRLELAPRQALSVDAAPGTIVRCLQGTIWLTQEGLYNDYILIPGMRFVSGSRGKIVLNALEASGTAQVYAPGCGTRPSRAGPGLQIDSGLIARVERDASRARAREFARLAGRLGTFAASAWNSLMRRYRHAAGH